jgi:hypothetical protein
MPRSNYTAPGGAPDRHKVPRRMFRLFQDRVYHWLYYFGLKGWDVYFEQIDLAGAEAAVKYDLPSRQAAFALAQWWPSLVDETNIDRAAFHEVMHLALGRIETLATARFTTENAIDEEIHHLIRLFENVVWQAVG